MQANWKREVAIFMTSQGVSLFGSSLVQFAITWYITLTTKSGVYATISILCGFLPMLLLSPFAGVWADRYNRKTLIMVADGVIALCTLVLALVFLTGFKPIWLLFVVSAVRSMGSAVQSPAIGAMLPDVVPPEHLARVNGINSSVQSLITLASPMISGALMGLVSIEKIFFIDVITAALAIVILLFFLKITSKGKASTQKGAATDYFGQMKEGFSYILGHPFLKQFLGFAALFMLVVAPAAFLTPLQVARTFGGDVWRLTATEMAFSVGMVLGGVAMATWGGMKNRMHTIFIACFGMGACALLLGLPPTFMLYLIFMGLFGISLPMFNTSGMVILQERVDPAYMGRTMSIMTMLNGTMMPLGMVIFGPLADVISVEWVMRISGLLMIVLTIIICSNRALMKAGERAPAPTAEGIS